MENVKELKSKELEIRNKIYAIQEAREKELLPKYRKEFIGKCFKIRNSYGDNKDKWWLYLKILDVESVNFLNGEEPIFKTLQCQYDNSNIVNFDIKEYSYVRTDYISISKQEYNMAVSKILDKINEFLDKGN